MLKSYTIYNYGFISFPNLPLFLYKKLPFELTIVSFKINNLQKLAHFTPSGQHVEKRSFALDPTHVEANDGSIEGSILM